MFTTKKIPLFALLSFLAGIPAATAQDAPMGTGLYRSPEDFQQHRLTLAGNCKTDQHRLRLHERGSKPYVTVVHQGKEHKLAKASLFGFRDCDGHDYRFAPGNKHYPILNPGEELLIYKLEQAAVGQNPGYVHLFFSPTAAAPIQPLTLLNLKKAYPTNHRLHDMLDAQFQPGHDLAAYDKFHRMSKINWLLLRSRVPTGAR